MTRSSGLVSRFAVAACGLWLSLWSFARGAEPPHLQFVHGLRANGLPDLALEYLARLEKNASPELAKVLPLEKAKTLVDLAQLRRDAVGRDATLAKARDEFNTFIKNNPKTPAAAEAGLELAHIVNLQGKAKLAFAQRQEAAAGKKAALDAARQIFDQAAAGMQAAAAQINEQLTRPDLAPADKQALTQAKLQVQLDLGLNLLDKSQSFDEAEVLKRGEVVNQAKAELQKLASGDEKNPITWQAKAWVARCLYENDAPKDARAEIAAILASKSPAVEPGRRLARYVRILVLDKDIEDKNAQSKKIEAAEEWLKSYPEFKNTPEGYGVQFQLAESFLNLARTRPKSQLNSPEVRNYLGRAEAIFSGLERSDNEFSQQARERKLAIILTRSTEFTGNDPSKFKDFTEGYYRAQLEIARLMEEQKKIKAGSEADAKKNEQRRKDHLHNIVAYLNRALDLADDKSPPDEVNEARYLLAYTHVTLGELYQAAVLGEHLAYHEPKYAKSAAAADFALQAYARLIADGERDQVPQRFLDADRARVRRLATYMEKTWPTDPATDMARHQLAYVVLKDGNNAEAVAVLSRISPSFAAYTFAEWQLAMAALQLAKEGTAPPAGQPSYLEQAVAALRRIPDPGPNPGPGLAETYLNAKLQLASSLFNLRQYQEMEVQVDQLAKKYAELKNTVPEEFRKDLEIKLGLVPVYAKYGEADVAFRAGKFAEARKLLDPVVDQVSQNKLPELKDPQFIRNLLGLALRATVRDGDTKRANDLLNVLLQQTAGGLSSTAAILGDLIQQLKGQIEELRKKGPDAQAELDKTVASFSGFLDEMAKQPPDKLTPDLIRFLSIGYASLDKHDRAAELLNQFPEPPKDDADKVAFYHSVRLLYARELRLAKKFDEAAKVLKEINATEWGSKSLEAKKEPLFLLEDEGKHGAAARGWNQLMTNLRPQIEKNGKLKEQYFACYYQLVFCTYRHAEKLPDQARKQETVRRAATWIVKLKAGRPDMGSDTLKQKYDELLQKEAPLREQVERLEKGAQ